MRQYLVFDRGLYNIATPLVEPMVHDEANEEVDEKTT